MRLMKVGLMEANATPMHLIIRHLEYNSIESQVKEQKQNEQRQQ